MKSKTLYIVQAALIAAIYATITILLKPISFGPIQLRLSETLTLLPVILPSAIPGLFVGCLLANFLGGLGPIDIVLGSLATLMAAFSTYYLRKHKFLLALPPVIFNGLIVGAYVFLLYDKTYPMALTMIFIAASEFLICYGLGLPLLSLIRKNKLLRETLGEMDD